MKTKANPAPAPVPATKTLMPSKPPAVAEVTRPARRPSGLDWSARLWKGGYWALVLALVALNLVRLRDAWPPSDLPTIARMIERNRLDDAEGALRDRLRRTPFEGDSRINLAQILARRGDMIGASAQFRLVPPWWPSKPEALFREGQAALAAGLAVEAEAAWRSCLADDPLHPAPSRIFSASASELLGLLNLEGRFDESITLLWSISEGAPEGDRPSILQTIMDLRLRSRKVPTDPTSTARLQRFAEVDPGDITARLALARAARTEKKWDEALHWVDSALSARPDHLAAWAERLAILEARGDRVGFQSEVARLPRSDAVDADGGLWLHRALARESAGDLAGAAEAYRRAIALQGDDESLLDRASKVDERLGDGESARLNRCRVESIREARLALPTVYGAFLDATGGRRPEAELAPFRSRLADLSRTLGWDREASAWKRPPKL